MAQNAESFRKEGKDPIISYSQFHGMTSVAIVKTIFIMVQVMVCRPLDVKPLPKTKSTAVNCTFENKLELKFHRVQIIPSAKMYLNVSPGLNVLMIPNKVLGIRCMLRRLAMTHLFPIV